MVDRTHRIRRPWYRWHFSATMLLGIGLFGFMAWQTLLDEGQSWALRVGGAAVCAAVASALAWVQWIDCRNVR